MVIFLNCKHGLVTLLIKSFYTSPLLGQVQASQHFWRFKDLVPACPFHPISCHASPALTPLGIICTSKFLTVLCFSHLYRLLKDGNLPLLSCLPPFPQLSPLASVRPSSGLSSAVNEPWALRSGYLPLPWAPVALTLPTVSRCSSRSSSGPGFPGQSLRPSHLCPQYLSHISCWYKLIRLKWTSTLSTFSTFLEVLQKFVPLSKLLSLNYPILRDAFLPFKLQ